MKTQKEVLMETFKGELDELIASASGTDAAAMAAFSRAIAPYIENPDQLRTLLGKIANGEITSEDQQKLLRTSFATIEELNASLPASVTARLA